MGEDLLNELEAINSIYGADSIVAEGEAQIFILRLPLLAVSLRLHFPMDYPSAPPAVLGTESAGEHMRKGEAANLLAVFRDALGRLFHPGDVCLFDVIEEVNTVMAAYEHTRPGNTDHGTEWNDREVAQNDSPSTENTWKTPPAWILSDVVVELKSVFVARSAAVTSPDQAKQYVQHLLGTDKKVASATHNITAWRIKGEKGISYQDCDDDGETAAGGRVLHLMQLMDLWDVMVVVTRWYGGHQLGPKRFSIINAVARDAFVKGNFVQEDNASKKKAKR
ncbi:RWD repeat domain-containing protein [Phlyctema vagabunda]|uniref:RWD repeat domain-containing protein n=1 Tax=Phlyctema vagabunda TaxID=108571 RepID=A0ABR4PTJ9_9HELO